MKTPAALVVFASFLSAASFASTPAFTADITVFQPPQAAPPPVTQFDWSGPYIGLQAGYVFGQADHSFLNGAPSGDSSPDGFVGGVHAGYNWQADRFVFGVEADIEAAGVDGSFANPAGPSSVGTSELNWQASVRARLGYAMDRIMIYGTGGWAYGDFDFGGGPFPLPASGGYSEGLSGWTLGAGAEMAFTDTLLGRVEYRYTDFGTASGSLAPGFPGVTMPVDVKTHAVRFGVSYKF